MEDGSCVDVDCTMVEATRFVVGAQDGRQNAEILETFIRLQEKTGCM